MSIALAKADADELQDFLIDKIFLIFQPSPQLLIQTMGNTDRVRGIASGITFGGNNFTVSSGIVQRLSSYGQIEPGVEALGAFLFGILKNSRVFTGLEQEVLLQRLIQQYHLMPEATDTGIADKDWKGETFNEALIGEDTLQDVFVLELAFNAAKAVAHLLVPAIQDAKGGQGSGFLIADDLLMTNNHVVSTEEQSAGTVYTFNYQLDKDKKQSATQVVKPQTDGLFHTNKELDYTVVQLEESPDGVAPLKTSRRLLHPNEYIPIIQHPLGGTKKVSMRNNYIAYVGDKIVQYYTHTEQGSSGSPCFNEDFQVVALHHAGGMIEEPGTKRKYLRNEGIVMGAILSDLQTANLEIYEKITKVKE